MNFQKNIYSKIKKFFYKNFISIKEIKLLKKELKGGLVGNSNIYILFIILNLYLLLPRTYMNKSYKKSAEKSFEKLIGLIIFRKKFLFNDKAFYLDFLVIDSQYKRKGFGSEMINKMTRIIRDDSNNLYPVFIYLKTLKNKNNIGNKFYKKNKFDLLYSNYKYNFYFKKLNSAYKY